MGLRRRDACEESKLKPKKQVASATMKDVAVKANVSTATVSRALMNPEKVSQATRNRVEQAAKWRLGDAAGFTYDNRSEA